MFLSFKNLFVVRPLGWSHFLAAVSSVAIAVGVLVSLWRADSVLLVHISTSGLGGWYACSAFKFLQTPDSGFPTDHKSIYSHQQCVCPCPPPSLCLLLSPLNICLFLFWLVLSQVNGGSFQSAILPRSPLLYLLFFLFKNTKSSSSPGREREFTQGGAVTVQSVATKAAAQLLIVTNLSLSALEILRFI